MRIVPRLVLSVLFGLLGAGATLRAHDAGISTAQGQLRSDALELTTGFAPADAQQFVPPEARTTNRRMTAAEFWALHAAIAATGGVLALLLNRPLGRVLASGEKLPVS